MGELLVALAPFLLVLLLGLLGALVPLAWLASGALATIALGLAVGIPAGLGYHVLLRRALLRAGPLPGDWYWYPQRYHAQLSTPLRRGLSPWFVLGALGFMLIVLGFALAVTALAVWLRGGGDAVLA